MLAIAANVLSGCGKSESVGPARESGSSQNRPRSEAAVELSPSQLAAIKIEPVGTYSFPVEKEAVGSVSFDEDPAIVQAESTLLAAAATFQSTSKELARVEALGENNGIAQKELEQATADRQTAQAALKAAHDAVRALGKTDAEIDEMVAAGKIEAAPAGRRWVVANVSESDSPLLRLRQPARVNVLAFPGRMFAGRIARIYRTVDPTTHREAIRCAVEDPRGQLRPGMLADVVIRVREPVETTAVPAEAVVRESDGTMTAWVTADRRHFAQRVVQPGLQQGRPGPDPQGPPAGRAGGDGGRRLPEQPVERAAERLSEMFKGLIAFCLSRRAIVVFGLLLFAGGRVRRLHNNSTSRHIRIPRRSFSRSPPRPRDCPRKRWSATTRARSKSGSTRRPGSTSSARLPSTACPSCASSSSTAWTFISLTRQAAIALQQNVNLPGGQVPTIQQNSTTGEIYRYQVVGPKHFGITNLRTVQDWIVRRRLLTIPGIVQVNSWGGPTKQFDVEVDPRKLEAYDITVPQVLTALGNANLNVGGREIRIGQQSINIRGVGLIDDGGNDDLTQGYKIGDIENVVLTQQDGVPVLVKDVARVSVGFVPRLGIWGHDGEDDAVAGIVVMSRVGRANEMLPKVKAAIEQNES